MIPDLRKVVDELKTECASKLPTLEYIHAEGWFCPEDAAQASGMSRSHVSKMLKISQGFDRKRFVYRAPSGANSVSIFYRKKGNAKKATSAKK